MNAKDENERLRKENAELREKLASSNRRRKLSSQQLGRLGALVRGPSRLVDEPVTNYASGAWWQTHRSLADRGYATETIIDGSAAFEVTDEGRAVYRDLANGAAATIGAHDAGPEALQ